MLKNKLYSAINIVGLAAFIVIALYFRDQYSYDKQWKDTDRIYRVNCSVEWPGREPIKWSAAPFPAMPALKEYFKDNFEQTARALSNVLTINIGTDRFDSRWTQVDPSFIDIFQLIGAVLCGHDGRRGYLHHLAVHPDYRGRGIGKRLINKCLSALYKHGISRCNIFIYSDNEKGKEFWRKTDWCTYDGLEIMYKNVEHLCPAEQTTAR